MKQELIKPIIKVGNSAGVLVPKDWINGKARVELIQKPINVKKDIFEILGHYLKDIIGIYLVGSYARGEQTERSDVDILAVTNKKSGRTKSGKYDVLLITKNDINKAINNSALPIIPMLKEAKTIINEEYLISVKESPLSKKNLKWNIDMIKAGVELSNAAINIAKEDNNKYCSDAVSYSLVLNIRTAYIIDCIKSKIKWSSTGLLSLIKEMSGSLEAYNGYSRVKNDEKIKSSLPVKEAEKLLEYLYKKLKTYEKW